MSKFYGATGLNGGTAGRLDAINGAKLADGDGAFVISEAGAFRYRLNATSGADENVPLVVKPDDNPGTKRWIQVPLDLRFSGKKPQPLVTFCFDDGYATDLSVMLPVFNAQGEVACSCVVTDLIDTATHLTSANLQTLAAAGWEIVSHSKTHADLTGKTEAQVNTELAACKAFIETLGIECSSVAYPYSASNVMVRRVTRNYAQLGRGHTVQALNEAVLNHFQLRMQSADDHTQGAAYATLVDEAIADDRWLIFILHSTDANDVATMNTLIDYIQAAGVSIVTLEQGLALVGNVLDVGDECAVGERGMRGTLFAPAIVGRTSLEDTTDSETGVIYKGASSFIHNFQHPTGGGAVPSGHNVFVGRAAGNFTMGETATDIKHASYNTVVGRLAFTSNTTGYKNVAVGYGSLGQNTTGFENMAIGQAALGVNTSGYYNVAVGATCLPGNVDGNENVAIGRSAAFSNTGGDNNVVIGRSGHYYNQTGNNNVAIGRSAGAGVSGQSNSNNIFIGFEAGNNITTGDNNIVIGYQVDLDDPAADNQLNIGSVIKGNLSTGAITISGSLSVDYDVACGTVTPANGWSGSFTNGDSDTVTVLNGIITGVA